MRDDRYAMVVSLLTHTQRLLQAHATLLERSRATLTAAERLEHEQMLAEVKGVIEAQQRWIARTDGGNAATSPGRA